MVKFTNPFLSVKGQVERLANVKNTLVSAFSGGGVKADTGNSSLNKALSALASHPLTSSAIAAGGITAISNPSIATSLFSSLVPKSLAGKAVAAVALPAVAGAALKYPAEALEIAVSSPSKAANFGGNIATAVKQPSVKNVVNIAKENPVLTTAAVVTGIAATAGVANLASNYLNRSATQKNTEAIIQANTNPTTGLYQGDIQELLKARLHETQQPIIVVSPTPQESVKSELPVSNVVSTAEKPKKEKAKKKKSKKKSIKRKTTKKKSKKKKGASKKTKKR